MVEAAQERSDRLRLNASNTEKINSIKGLGALVIDAPLVTATFSNKDGTTSSYEARLATGANGLFLSSSSSPEWPSSTATLISLDILHTQGNDTVIAQRLACWPENARQALELCKSSTVKITTDKKYDDKLLFIKSIDGNGLICAAEIDQGIKATETYYQLDSDGYLSSPEFGAIGKIKSISALTCQMKVNLKENDLPAIPIMSYEQEPARVVDSIDPLELIHKGSKVSVTYEYNGHRISDSYIWHGVDNGNALLVQGCAALNQVPLNQIIDLNNFGHRYERAEDLALKLAVKPKDKIAPGHIQVVTGVIAREEIPLIHHSNIFND